MKKLCKIEGCGKEAHKNVLCLDHFKESEKIRLTIYRETHRNELRKKGNEYYAKNKDACRERTDAYRKTPKSREQQAKFREENRERLRQVQKDWKVAHPERKKEIQNTYRLKNMSKISEKTMRRYASQSNATPAWANQFFIEEIYDLARRRTKCLGIK